MHCDHEMTFRVKSDSGEFLLGYSQKISISVAQKNITEKIKRDPNEQAETDDAAIDPLTRFLCEKIVGFSDDQCFLEMNERSVEFLNQLFQSFQKREEVLDLDILVTKKNIKKVIWDLEQVYEMLLGPDGMNETVFIKWRTVSSTPIRCGNNTNSNFGQKTPEFSEKITLESKASPGKPWKSFSVVNLTQCLSTPRTPPSKSQEDFLVNSSLKDSAKTPDFPMREELTGKKSPENISFFSFTSPMIKSWSMSRTTTPTPLRRPASESGNGQPGCQDVDFNEAIQKYQWFESIRIRVRIDPVLRTSPELAEFFGFFSDAEIHSLSSMLENTTRRVVAEFRQDSDAPNLQSEDQATQAQCIYSFFVSVLTEVLRKELQVPRSRRSIESILRNESFLRALLGLCIETFFFIKKVEQNSFPRLLSILEITPFDFWKNIFPFCKFDTEMPVSIQKHLFHLEFLIMFEHIWTSGSGIYDFIGEIKEDSSHEQEMLTGVKRCHEQMVETNSPKPKEPNQRAEDHSKKSGKAHRDSEEAHEANAPINRFEKTKKNLGIDVFPLVLLFNPL